MFEKKNLACKIELKATADNTGSFNGYGAVFGNVDAHGDIIAPGAFAKSIARHTAGGTLPLMLLNHDIKSIPIGMWSDLTEDSYGLKASGTFLDTSTGADAYTAAKAGAITGLSIGYVPVESERTAAGNRLLTEIDLKEISLVTFPSNDSARVVDVKSIDAGLLTAMSAKLDQLTEEVKNLASKIEVKGDGDGEEGDECEDDDDCDEDCDCGEDGECEEKSQTKYNATVLKAVKNLSLKLKQEHHGR